MKKHVLIGLCVLVGLCLVLLPVATGCKSPEEKVAEEIAEHMIESGDGNVDVDIDSDGDEGSVHISSDEGEFDMTVGDDSEWPEDLPGYVPQLDGDIIQVMAMDMEGGKQYTVVYENLDDTDMESYVDELESNGWDVESQMDFNDTWMVQASYGDDEWYITAGVTYDDSSGTLSVIQGE